MLKVHNVTTTKRKKSLLSRAALLVTSDDRLSPQDARWTNCYAPKRRFNIWRVAVVRLARQRITNVASRDPKESYRRALDEIRKDFPDLWRAWQDGFLREDDFSTVALLVPSSSGEIERGKCNSHSW